MTKGSSAKVATNRVTARQLRHRDIKTGSCARTREWLRRRSVACDTPTLREQSGGSRLFRPWDVSAKSLNSKDGRVAEWFKAPVLKTGVPARVPWVRIPPLPPLNVADFAGHALPQRSSS